MSQKPIATVREHQAVLSYFAPTLAPVFKIRWPYEGADEIVAHFSTLREMGESSASSNLGCWHTGYDSLGRWPAQLGPFAQSVAQTCWQVMAPGRKTRVEDFRPERLDIELWYADYDPGGYAQQHSHGYDTISFCYYLDVAEGGSDFVVHQMGLDVGQPVERSQVSIPVATGDLLIFQGFLPHSVPPTEGRRRVIAGNIRGIGRVLPAGT